MALATAAWFNPEAPGTGSRSFEIDPSKHQLLILNPFTGRTLRVVDGLWPEAEVVPSAWDHEQPLEVSFKKKLTPGSGKAQRLEQGLEILSKGPKDNTLFNTSWINTDLMEGPWPYARDLQMTPATPGDNSGRTSVVSGILLRYQERGACRPEAVCFSLPDTGRDTFLEQERRRLRDRFDFIVDRDSGAPAFIPHHAPLGGYGPGEAEADARDVWDINRRLLLQEGPQAVIPEILGYGSFPNLVLQGGLAPGWLISEPPLVLPPGHAFSLEQLLLKKGPEALGDSGFLAPALFALGRALQNELKAGIIHFGQSAANWGILPAASSAGNLGILQTGWHQTFFMDKLSVSVDAKQRGLLSAYGFMHALFPLWRSLWDQSEKTREGQDLFKQYILAPLAGYTPGINAGIVRNLGRDYDRIRDRSDYDGMQTALVLTQNVMSQHYSTNAVPRYLEFVNTPRYEEI